MTDNKRLTVACMPNKVWLSEFSSMIRSLAFRNSSFKQIHSLFPPLAKSPAVNPAKPCIASILQMAIQYGGDEDFPDGQHRLFVHIKLRMMVRIYSFN